MKLKVGHKLFAIREERKLNQLEMAELLNLTPSSYSRLERGETSVELEQLVQYAKTLNIPIQELMPEILSINSNSANGQGGLVFGNYYNNIYNNSDDRCKELELKLELLKTEKDGLVQLNKQLQNLNEILLKQLSEK